MDSNLLPRKEYATGFIDFNKFSCDYKRKAIRFPLSKNEKGTVEQYRGRKEYIAWRDAVRERDNYTCQRCGSKENVVAHHILGFSEYPFLRNEIENGVTLCHECHKIVHREIIEEENKRIYNIVFDEHYVVCSYKGSGYNRKFIHADRYKDEPTKEQIYTAMKRYEADAVTVEKEYSNAQIPFFDKDELEDFKE